MLFLNKILWLKQYKDMKKYYIHKTCFFGGGGGIYYDRNTFQDKSSSKNIKEHFQSLIHSVFQSELTSDPY